MEYGLTQTPFITHHHINEASSNEEIYIITACDGIEPMENWIGSWITEKMIEKSDELGQLGQKLAYDCLFSNDNVSVVITKLSHRIEPINVPLAISIYDGHGSDAVAKLLKRLFLPFIIARTHVELQKNTIINSTFFDYLSEVEAAFTCSDDVCQFYIHQKRADAIKTLLDDKFEKINNSKLFTATPTISQLYKKDMSTINKFIDSANREYGENPSSFTQLKSEVLQRCKEMRGLHLEENEETTLMRLYI